MLSINKKSVFYIDSNNKLSSTDTHGNFSVKIEMPPNTKYNRVCLINCLLPKTYYMVMSGYNTFSLSENGTVSTVTLTPGNYSRSVFLTSIVTALNTASSHSYTYTASMASSSQVETGKINFGVSGNGAIQPIFIFTTNVNELFGFNMNSSNQFTVNALTSANVIKLQSEDCIFIKSNIVASSTNAVLQEIYTSQVPFLSSIVFYQVDTELNAKELNYNNLNVFSFQLTSESGRIIDFNGINVLFSIACWQHNDTDELVKNNLLIKNLEKIKN